MKLFKSLLVAPATLGLLAPIAATANEVTINDFNPAEELAVTNSRVDGLEARLNNFEAGSFSSTTTATFGVNFYVGAVDGGTVATSTPGATTANLTTGAVTTAAPTAGTAAAEAVTFSYDYAMDLSTSFTGEDSLDIAIIGGNADGDTVPVDAAMGGDGTGDGLLLDGISYTFPLGNATVIVGDGVGVDDMNTGACAYSAFTDLVSDCAANNVGGSADSAIAIGYDFGNGFTMAGGVGGGTGTLMVSSQKKMQALSV